MASRSFEQESGEINELLFSELNVGNVVVLGTASGSLYRLSIEEVSGTPAATVERSSDHAVKTHDIEDWELVNPDTLFDLRGSCTRMYISHDGPTALEVTEGHFVVGERAWLVAQLGEKEGALVTSTIRTLQVQRNPQAE